MSKPAAIALIVALLMTVPLSGTTPQGMRASAPSSAPAGLAMTDVQRELEARITEMVALGHLAPTLYFGGLGGGGTKLEGAAMFYVTPSETLYTLSAAYPYLSVALQGQVKSYLDNELASYPPHENGFYPPLYGTVSDMIGARREYYVPSPDERFNYWPFTSVHISVLYALWLYSSNTDDWRYVTDHYDALRTIYRGLEGTGSITSYPELSGVIGFSRIAQHLGKSADYSDAASFAEAGFASGADFDRFLEVAHLNYPHGSHSYTTPIFMFNRNPVAVHFDRDIGQFLRERAAMSVAAYAQQVASDVPLWWLTGVAMSHGENAYATPEISWTNFMLHAYVLDTPVEQLWSYYLDVPDRKGDLLYMQKLVAILDQEPDLKTSDKAASDSTPETGQVVTYTVTIHNTGVPLTDTVAITDTVPLGLSYLPGSLAATSGVCDDGSAPVLRWSGWLSDVSTVAVSYAATVTVPANEILVINNVATIGTGSLGYVPYTCTIIVNGFETYLPVIWRGR